MNIKILGVALLLVAGGSAMAESKPGTETREWVQLQKSGKAASKQARPIPGEVAEKSYERYVKSFDRPIPEHYSRESFVSGGSDSGGGSK